MSDLLLKQRRHYAAQLAMLTAALSNPDRTCTASDIPADPGAKYEGNAGWVGCAVLALMKDGIIHRVGEEPSSRPSRHGTEIKRWRVTNEDVARRTCDVLRAFLEHHPAAPSFTDTLFPDFFQQIRPAGATAGRTEGNREATHE